MQCHACQQPIDLASGERVGFREECPRCGGDLHACVQCAHYDPGAYNHCREPQSERVADKERANRCDWFQPAQAGAGRMESERQKARVDLDALFKRRPGGEQGSDRGS